MGEKFRFSTMGEAMIKSINDSGPTDDKVANVLGDIPSQMAIPTVVAIQRLKDAYDSAFSCSRDPWDFSVELNQMQSAGVETHVLRTLICKGWIVHQVETTDANQSRRTFDTAPELALNDRSCFVISKQGYAISEAISLTNLRNNLNNQDGRMLMSLHHSGPSKDPNENPEPKKPSQLGSSSHSHQQLKPVWDRERRELRFGDIVVKRFKWPAENQELVLNAFEDLGWPKRIDNPLEAHPTICPKRRLHDTLKCLNRKQVNELIKFRGDGTGLGVLLEVRLVE